MKYLWILGLFALPAVGQISNPSIITVTTAPSGSCTAGLPNQQVLSTGTQYSCQAGTWASIGGGGSSISLTTTGTGGAATLTAGTLNIPVYASALGNQTAESGNFNASCTVGSNTYYVSATATATLPSSVTTGCVMNFQVANGITLTFSSGTVTYTGPTAVTGPQSISVLTDGTNWNATPMGFLNLIQASGSPYTMPAITGTFWNNTASAYSWDLPTPYSGLQICVGNYQARATAQSLIPGTGVTIYFKGAAGTAGSGTGLVSGGAAGDFICLEGTSATTYMAIGAGYGTWTNH